MISPTSPGALIPAASLRRTGPPAAPKARPFPRRVACPPGHQVNLVADDRGLAGMAEAIGLVHDRGDRTTVCHSLEDSSTRPARWLGMRRLVPQQVTFWPELIGHQTKNLVLCRRPVESTMILDGRTGHAGSSIYHGVLPTTGRTPCKNCWTPSSNA